MFRPSDRTIRRTSFGNGRYGNAKRHNNQTDRNDNAPDTTIKYRAWDGKVRQDNDNQTPHWNWRKAWQAKRQICPTSCRGGETLTFSLSLEGTILRIAAGMAERKPQPFTQLQLE